MQISCARPQNDSIVASLVGGFKCKDYVFGWWDALL